MTGPPVSSELLRGRRDQLLRQTENVLLTARSQGRDTLTPAETETHRQAVDELRSLDAEISRVSQINSTLARLTGGDTEHTTTSTPRTAMRTNDSHLTYRRGGSESWIKDVVRTQCNLDDSGEARRRLAQHSDEVRTDASFMEFRDLSRVDGQGGYGVAPVYLMDQYVELARPGRAFANLCQRLPLPAGDVINIPKLLTGTAVGIQPADNTAVTDVDLTDTLISAPVRTIAGMEGVSLQLLEQSQIQFDEIVFQDLVAAHAGMTDTQVLYGTGTSGQVLGVENTPGITSISVSSVTIQGIYSAIANAIQLIHTTRFLPPDVIVMHPRRWGWLLSLLDSQDRPLVLPYANGPMNVAGVLTDVDSQQIVGSIAGLPVVTDPNMTVTAGSESPVGIEDQILVMRARDVYLWETGPRLRVLPEVKAQNLTVVLQLYSYLAFTAARFPQSIVSISGLTPPSF